eukprot:m.364193 g.364193  ORF g.364193 m.364193 type:complete len:467 (+) comp25942_c0_seq1:218-1618(+)
MASRSQHGTKVPESIYVVNPLAHKQTEQERRLDLLQGQPPFSADVDVDVDEFGQLPRHRHVTGLTVNEKNAVPMPRSGDDGSVLNVQYQSHHKRCYLCLWFVLLFAVVAALVLSALSFTANVPSSLSSNTTDASTSTTDLNQQLHRQLATLETRVQAQQQIITSLECWKKAQVESEPTLQLSSHTNGVRSFVLSENGSRLFSGSWDSTIKVWNVELGAEELMFTLSNHTGPVIDLKIDSREAWLYSASEDRTVYVWDITRSPPVPVFRLTGHTGVVKSLLLSADDMVLFSGSSDTTIRKWDLGQHPPATVAILTGHTGAVHSFAVSTNTPRLYSGSADATIRVWALDVSPPQPLFTLRGHTGTVYDLNLFPSIESPTRLYAGDNDGGLRVWDLSQAPPTGNVLQSSTSGIYSTVLSSDATVGSVVHDKLVGVSLVSAQHCCQPTCMPARKDASIKQGESISFCSTL